MLAVVSTVEGTVTANASGYDKNTAFFDCIYVQDDTRGINVFPVAGNYAEGMKVRVHGGVTYYCGEIELNLSSDYNGSIEIISDDITPLEPQLVTAKAAMADENIGNLMRVEGKITEIHKTAGVVDKIYVQDETGTALLFINGYITSTDTSLDKLTVGMPVSGIGLGSRDVDEESADSAIFARLRVRDRADIHEISAPHTHTWGPWETTEQAGCFHEGTQTRSCSGCGATETRTIPANSDNCPSKAFTDRPDRGWYHESVDYVLETGLMNGMGKGKFEPDTTLNRAMVATVLYRLSGDNSEIFVGRDYERTRSYSEQTAAEIDAEVRKTVDQAYAHCTQILTEHHEKLQEIAQWLLEHETMSRSQFEACMQALPIPEKQEGLLAGEEKTDGAEED